MAGRPWTPLPDPDDALFIPLSKVAFERAPAIPRTAREGLVQPRLVIDPQIPAPDRRALIGLSPGDLLPLSWDVPQSRREGRFRPWAALLSLFSRTDVPPGEPAGVQLARAYHGRYLVPDVDLDNPARLLLARAQVARAKATGAAVAEAGLLDADAADMLLAEQEWDIAVTLYRQARLRALHQQTNRDAGQATRQVEAPQLAALDKSVEAVTRRVEALEKYARFVVDADAAYRDWRQSLELAGRNEDHRELLARTVRDEQGIEEIAGLSDQARQVGRNLRASLRDAAHIAETLATGPASPSAVAPFTERQLRTSGTCAPSARQPAAGCAEVTADHDTRDTGQRDKKRRASTARSPARRPLPLLTRRHSGQHDVEAMKLMSGPGTAAWHPGAIDRISHSRSAHQGTRHEGTDPR